MKKQKIIGTYQQHVYLHINVYVCIITLIGRAGTERVQLHM